MSESPSPPKSWEVITGEWTIDLGRSIISENSDFAIILKNTAVASKIRSDWIAVSAGVQYLLGIRAQTTNNTAGYNLTMKVEKYSNNYIQYGTDTHVFSFNNTSTWEWKCVEWNCISGGFLKLTFEKTTNLHDIYLTRVLAEPSPAREHVIHDATQSINSGTWTTVSFTPAVSYGFSSSGVALVCEVPGYYQFSGSVQFAPVSDGTVCANRLAVYDGSTTTYYYGSRIASAVNGFEPILPVAHEPILLFDSDTVRLQVWHNEGVAVNLPNYFGAHRGTRWGLTRTHRL